MDGASDRACGLAEWCRLRLPRERVQTELGGDAPPEDDLRAVQRAWKLPIAGCDKWPGKPEEWLSPDLVITGDPVLMLGMSTWTTGWRSCMTQPSGAYRRGVIAWAALSGTRVAALLSEKTMTVADVTRRRMQARCLVHQLRGTDGPKVYDRAYGDQVSIMELKAALRLAGYISINDARALHLEETRIRGNVSARYTPYCDSLRKLRTRSKRRDVWVFRI